ncbi:MAG: hypothetical protein J2P25_00715 [Nocardiopsaceae bacterium]|nr:hypothetical protein [Nocardiopsaceae bacterium]
MELVSRDYPFGIMVVGVLGLPPVDVMEASLVGSVLLLFMGIAMGITAIWDIGGVASRMRADLEEWPLFGGLYRRMPSWTFRAFGIWCIIFGIGQLIFMYSITRGVSR